MLKEVSIFKEGSRTFFVSSLFFPTEIRSDIFDLYSFLRMADDYVDKTVPDTESFYQLRDLWPEAVKDPDFSITKNRQDSTNLLIAKNMARVSKKYEFEKAWIKVFLDAMESDLKAKKYKTLDDTLEYMKGSSEVVGLMMAKIMGLDEKASEAARLQGRAWQFINFIRDIEEDNQLGRQYFPESDLKKFKLKDLSRKTATTQTENFIDFIHFEIERYKKWQAEADKGYKYIPKPLRTPINMASDIYGWTGEQISANPLVVYDKKVKPSRAKLIIHMFLSISRQVFVVRHRP